MHFTKTATKPVFKRLAGNGQKSRISIIKVIYIILISAAPAPLYGGRACLYIGGVTRHEQTAGQHACRKETCT